ncbi:MAG: hypothetical protein ACKO96_21635, partial [Flammeovirgaceae bacterium]
MKNGFSVKFGTFDDPKKEDMRIVFDTFWIMWYVLSSVYTFCDKPTGLVISFSTLVMKFSTSKLYNLDLTDKVLGG